ncbi:MAG: cyclic nucleotide-binding domain-containing protein [Deltaproteobacteria bacterium]|nr:cyclic nucleotide-binding domain-containing protein [Deltaproteobacteria bacterium]MBW1846776.1 cyclic nucleotide-binding domain-containing protein [Deltaproteobacteria bacterium]MBW2178895.1 cyclic nucleotide-binding domain-containing protein [Deltaproteobacteria bacterium]
MVTIKDLKAIVILGFLTDDMIDKFLPITESLKFDEGEVVFREGENAERFYMVRRGKILLEQRISEKITISMGTVKPGYAFGWSAMLGGTTYTSDAVCAERSEVFSVNGIELTRLLDKDPSMGYRMTQRVLRIIKKRLEIRTEQFLRAIKDHPDIQHLVEK